MWLCRSRVLGSFLSYLSPGRLGGAASRQPWGNLSSSGVGRVRSKCERRGCARRKHSGRDDKERLAGVSERMRGASGENKKWAVILLLLQDSRRKRIRLPTSGRFLWRRNHASAHRLVAASLKTCLHVGFAWRSPRPCRGCHAAIPRPLGFDVAVATVHHGHAAFRATSSAMHHAADHASRSGGGSPRSL